jgi:Leucine-rich repeat (LRR) protein
MVLEKKPQSLGYIISFIFFFLSFATTTMSNSICQSKLDLIANDIAQGQTLTKVDLSNCNLTEFPLDLLLPCKDTLEMINFGGNSLSSLPEEIAEFRKLRILFFAQNKFNHIPDILGSLPSLYMLSFKSNIVERVSATSLSPSIRWLILTDNKISGKLNL